MCLGRSQHQRDEADRDGSPGPVLSTFVSLPGTEAGRNLSIIRHDLSARPRAPRPPDRFRDAGTQGADRPVHEQDVHDPTAVPAARGYGRVREAGRRRRFLIGNEIDVVGVAVAVGVWDDRVRREGGGKAGTCGEEYSLLVRGSELDVAERDRAVVALEHQRPGRDFLAGQSTAGRAFRPPRSRE